MDPPSQQPALSKEEAGVRQLFIWALVAGFIPFLGLPVVWGLAALGWRRGASPTYRSWHRWLVALAVVDTLVAAATFHLRTVRPGNAGMSALPSASRRVLGVTADPEYPGPGLRLSEVQAQGPAATAGLRVGEVVHQANGHPLDSARALSEQVQATPPGTPVRLEVEREGTRREVEVTSVAASTLAPPPLGLFEPRKLEPGSFLSPDVLRNALSTLLVVGVLLGLWALGRARGADARGLGVIAAIAAAVLGSAGTMWGLFLLLGGPSRGAALLGAWAQTLAMLLVALVFLKRGSPPPEGVPTRSWLRVYFIGLGLLVALMPRASTLLNWLMQVLDAHPEAHLHPIMGVAQQGPMGPLGWVLLALPVALLAPVSEELVFRGVLLPWLNGWMRRTAALAVSAGIFAALHLHYGVLTGWIFILGLLLGWMRLASGGLRAPMLLHATVNSFALLVLALL